jgi:hypothetical protein
MFVNPIDLAKKHTTNIQKAVEERKRQELIWDDRFYKSLTYFFELIIPSPQSTTAGQSFLFPILMPQGYTMSEPFAMEATNTLGGGLHTEENGIIQRVIRINGTTGFKPRPVKGNYAGVLNQMAPESKSFDRMLSADPATNKLSGQRHIQYLQDAVFRTYADYKRDPATSEGTRLLFHNPQDMEHWEVKPQGEFKLTREKTYYKYDIELLVVGPAAYAWADFSEDADINKTMMNPLKMALAGLALLKGALEYLIAAQAWVISLGADINNIINIATEIVAAAREFVAGTAALIKVPFATVDALGRHIDEYLKLRNDLVNLKDDIKEFPAEFVQKLREMGDGLDMLATHPESYETPAWLEAQEIAKEQLITKVLTTAGLALALDTPPPATEAEATSTETGANSADIAVSEGDLGINATPVTYTGARQIIISQGDTLVNLAAKYLGDGRKWQQIAIVNGMKPPFVDVLANQPLGNSDEVALPGAFGLGRPLLIPTFSRPPSTRALSAVLGSRTEDTAEVQLLGRDLALVQVAGRSGAPVYDWAVDSEHGSTSLKTVEGVDNIAQALILRHRTERGSNPLYKQLGVERVIGFNSAATDLELVRHRLSQCTQQDPRVASVRDIEFKAIDDSFSWDAKVELYGFTESANIKSDAA